MKLTKAHAEHTLDNISIADALSALDDIEARIAEIREAFGMYEGEENAWKREDKFADFHHSEIGDPAPALQLVGLGLGMGAPVK